MSSTIIINGISFTGRNITVINNKVIIDGVEATIPDAKEINITVNGNLDKLSVDACNQVDITGDCQQVKTASGDVRVGGAVGGKVESASGNITVQGAVTGDVSSMSGNVNCGNVGGRVKTMTGNIRHS